MANSAAPIVKLYHERKIMKSLGITTSAEDVDAWEITAYSIIESEISKLRDLEIKKNGSRRNNRY